jgi:hypothetical protein
MVPCVVRKTAGVSDVGQWEVRVRALDASEVLGFWRPFSDSHTDGDAWYRMDMSFLVALVRAVDAEAAS